VEEFFLHLWDEFDDIAGVCRHVTTAMAAEFVAAAEPLIAAAAGSLLAGAATLLLSHRHLLNLFA
jgi:quinol monooxygenase YgiN